MTKYFEKDSIIVSDCYAYEDGTITYKEDNSGNMHVYIGQREYQYSPNSIYYYPDGAQVKKFDRICSGVVNMQVVANELGPNRLNDIYLIFRNQFYTLTDDSFVKTGLSALDSTQEEIIELLFVGLSKMTYDEKTSKLEDIQYQGTGQAILNKKSFYTVLSYGYSSKVVGKALKKDVDLSGDVIIIKCCPKLNIEKFILFNLEFVYCWKNIINNLISSSEKEFNDYVQLNDIV